MAKLILLLLILFSVLVPVTVAESKVPRRTLKLLQYATVAMTFLWGYLCLVYYPQLVDAN